jgi:peptidoglycan/xylan/chitin deacetylase (PgdA/CDA1 family)
LQTIGWNVRTYDTAAKNSSTIINKVAKHVNSNSIILLHDRVELTTRALPQIIEKVNGMGFAFGPLDLKN